MELCKVWDATTERWRVDAGGVWQVEASCVLADGAERWVLDELPAELNELEFGDIQDWRQREDAERRMGDSLLKWLGLALDRPPQQRVRHKVWRKQLVGNTRQLKLGADRATQRTDMEVLDGTEVVRVVGTPEAGPVVEGEVGTGAGAGT